MSEELRFCRTADGTSIAYLRVGTGPVLVLPAWWYSHLDLLWAHPPARTFFTTLAEHFTVIYYDEPGCGLSDRTHPAFTLEERVAVLGAVIAHLDVPRVGVFGFSQGGRTAIRYAATHPEQVAQLVLFSTAAHTPAPADPEAAAAVWQAARALIHAHWGLGSSTVMEMEAPGADALTRQWQAAHMRAAVDPDTAVAKLEAFRASDVRPDLARIVAPTLVLHRRDDQAFAFERGRELAAGIAGARFLPLDGSWHVLYQGEDQDVLRATIAYLEEPTIAARFTAVVEPRYPDGLSEREVQVLRLVATGQSSREIAAWLVLSPHTVNRHIANIFNKTGVANRTEAAAYAVRHRLTE